MESRIRRSHLKFVIFANYNISNCVSFVYLVSCCKAEHNNTLLMTFTIDNIPEIEAHLNNHPTLSEGGAPGPLDATIYLALGKTPDRQATPNLYYWYLFLSTFTPVVINRWAEQGKPAQTKPAATKNEDDFDPFADDTEPKKEVEKPKPKVEKKAAKPKPIAKSIVVFDVKIYDMEVTNLDQLANKIMALKIEGLVWNNTPKKLDVAFGVKKLQMGCVIEDDKVLTDDIFDQILAWEDDVQSVDMVSMQKL